jgi:hypothetical protein
MTSTRMRSLEYADSLSLHRQSKKFYFVLIQFVRLNRDVLVFLGLATSPRIKEA